MISLSSFEKWMLTSLMWSKNLSLQLWSIFPPKLLSLIWSGFSKDIFSTIFFQKSYVSISSNPPTQYISNYKQLVVPTHPLFCLCNIWTAPKVPLPSKQVHTYKGCARDRIFEIFWSRDFLKILVPGFFGPGISPFWKSRDFLVPGFFENKNPGIFGPGIFWSWDYPGISRDYPGT